MLPIFNARYDHRVQPHLVVVLELHAADLHRPVLVRVHHHVERHVRRLSHLLVFVLQQVHEVKHHLRGGQQRVARRRAAQHPLKRVRDLQHELVEVESDDDEDDDDDDDDRGGFAFGGSGAAAEDDFETQRSIEMAKVATRPTTTTTTIANAVATNSQDADASTESDSEEKGKNVGRKERDVRYTGTHATARVDPNREVLRVEKGDLRMFVPFQDDDEGYHAVFFARLVVEEKEEEKEEKEEEKKVVKKEAEKEGPTPGDGATAAKRSRRSQKHS